MQVANYIIVGISIAYGIFISIAIVGFLKIFFQKKIEKIQTSPTLFISIIISARNEAENIEACIQQLIKQSFNKQQFELIIIDDASTDCTYEILKSVLTDSNLNFQLIKQTTQQGKKKNLAQAIQLAKGDVIITSDADVVDRNENWLNCISQYFETHHPNMLIMPIDFIDETNFLSKFQIVENLALTAISVGYAALNNPFMCSGANLAFKKTAYTAVNGYQSHINKASGDDVLLLEDIKKLDHTLVHYCFNKDSIVKTKTQQDIKAFIHQRVRWAGKFKHNPNSLNFFGGLIVVLVNVIPIALLISVFTQAIIIIPYLVTFSLAKLIFDFLLLFLASQFLGKTKYLWWLVPFECIYWLYAFVIGTSSWFLKPNWKN